MYGFGRLGRHGSGAATQFPAHFGPEPCHTCCIFFVYHGELKSIIEPILAGAVKVLRRNR